jgi:predicted short-subunit dehydrogenase-like oxidoreductase (DUF2520 family)
VWGRNVEKTAALASILQTTAFEQFNAIPDDYDCCIIAVTDNAIASIAQQLSFQKTTVVHTAGSQSLSILPQTNKAVVWPIYSITQTQISAVKDVPIVVEASNETSREKITSLAKSLSTKVLYADEQQRQWMHLIATFGNNFCNHILAICEHLAKEQNLSFEVFKPILKQTFERILANSPTVLQTGAAKRNDQVTMQHHLKLLQAHPQWQAVYENISASIKDMYSTKGK